MTKPKSPRAYFLFRASVIAGFTLALISAGIAFSTFLFVSQHLAVDHLNREAGRYAAMLEYEGQEKDIETLSQLDELLRDMQRREERQVAWFRVINRKGATIAQSGIPSVEAFSDQDLDDVLEMRKRNIVKRRTSSEGELFVCILPFRFQLASEVAARSPQSGPERTRRFKLVEVALYLGGAEEAFAPLERNLAVGIAAPLALLAALIFMMLRLPAYLRGRELEQQLDLARRVQRDLLPRGTPEAGGLEISSEFVPFWGVGGDYYDVFTLDSDRTFIVLGDVSGKGLPAALIMGLLHGMVRTASRSWDGTNHHELTSEVNRLLCSSTASNRFVTFFWSCYEPLTGQMRFINAGHNPPVLVRPSSGACEIEEIAPGGPVLGLLPNAVYEPGETRLRPGDLLVIFSDGLVEAADADDVEFGQERLEAILRENCQLPPEDLKRVILSELKTFLGKMSLQDDLTLLVAKVTDEATRSA